MLDDKDDVFGNDADAFDGDFADDAVLGEDYDEYDDAFHKDGAQIAAQAAPIDAADQRALVEDADHVAPVQAADCVAPVKGADCGAPVEETAQAGAPVETGEANEAHYNLRPLNNIPNVSQQGIDAPHNGKSYSPGS